MRYLRRFAFLNRRKSKRRRVDIKNKSRRGRAYKINPYTGKKLNNSESSPERGHIQITFSTKGAASAWFGSDMSGNPDKSDARLVFMNCKGLAYTDTNFFKCFLTQLKQCHAHFFGLAEINVNTCNAELVQKMMSAVDEAIPGGIFQMKNTPIFDAAVEYQPGGVASGICGRLSRYYEGGSSDEIGRWCCDTFKGPQNSVKIYTLYRVNPKPNNAGGGCSAWEQQQVLLRTRNIDVDPRAQVITSLVKVLQEDIRRGFAIVLMSDLNEGIDDREGTNGLLEDIGLENVFHSMYGSLPATYIHGSKAIDHVWMTQDIIPYVSSMGIAPHKYISHSDHRALICDVKMEQFLGRKELMIQPVALRKLKSSCPKRLAKYNKKLINDIKFHKLFHKWELIKGECEIEGVGDAQVQKIDNLDARISELMQTAERKSTSVTKSFLDPWSMKLNDAIQDINHWSYEKRQAYKCNDDGIFDLEKIKYVLQKCEEAREEYRKIHVDADSYREQMQMDQATALANKRNEFGDKVQNYVKVIQHMEARSKSYKKIQFSLGKRKGNPLYAVLVPSRSEYDDMDFEDGDLLNVHKIWDRIQVADGADIVNWTKIEDRATIVKLMLDWQQKHFQQAAETPLTTDEWEELLENRDVEEDILNETFEPKEGLPDECKLLLQYMRRRIPDCVTYDISFNEYKDFYRKADESTSSSPSGRHYGHYKALLNGNDDVLRLMHDILIFCLKHGIILERWRRSVTSLIEKKHGKPFIHKFRTIHVVESELQLFSKLVYAKKMMQAAEKGKVITNDQYGGRNRRQALSIVVNKMMYYSICQQTKMKCAFMDDDAKACYDRIVPSLALIESRKWGVTHDTNALTRKILKSQKFYVRTGHGISEAFYSYCKKQKIFGAGQGLGWSGPLWINTSDTISQILNDKCAGMKFMSFDGKIVVVKKGDFFIDDTATGVTSNCVKAGKTVLMQLKDDEQLHAFLLFAAGHRLALHKCSFYLVDFAREDLKYRCLNMDELPGVLQLQEGFDLPYKTVPRLEPWKAHKTLGHMISVAGNTEAQRQVVIDVIAEWVKRIQMSTLNRSDRLLAYSAFLLPALRYKIMSLSLSYRDCKDIMKPLIPILLNAHSIHRNVSRNLLFQPRSRLGLGYLHLYHIQNLEKIKLLFLHIRIGDTTGELLRIAMGYIGLECGCGQNFFSLQFSKYAKYTTNTWLHGIWQYVQECKSSITLTDVAKYKCPRENDEFLMHIVENTQLDNCKKIIFNHIRLHLHLVTLSDIVYIDKKSTIRQEIFCGRNSRASKWNWPRKINFPKKWLNVWDSILRTYIQPRLQNRPLGRWLHTTHQIWHTFTNDDISMVRIHEDIFRYDRGLGERVQDPMLCLYPVDMENMKVMGRIKNMYAHEKVMKPQESSSAILQVLSSIPAPLEQNLGVSLTVEKLIKIRKAIQANRCVGAGDGSLRHQYPSHAWCLADDQTGALLIQGSAQVNGNKNHISSFRAEGMAIIAQLTVLHVIDSVWGLHGTSVIIYSDCDSVLKKIKTRADDRLKFALADDIDIVLQIRKLLSKIDCYIRLEYVKSHQDRILAFQDAPFPQQLNILMDEAVRLFIDENYEHVPRIEQYPFLDATTIVLGSNSDPLISGIEEALILNFSEAEWKAYSQSKFGIKNSDLVELDGACIGKAMNSYKMGASQITKIIHGQQHTMEKSMQWKTATTDVCPLCLEVKEENFHVWRCCHKTLNQMRRTERLNLEKTLRKLDTDENVMTIINHILDYWDSPDLLEEKLSQLQFYGDNWDQVWRSQKKLGWKNFLLGIISKEFATRQEEWYRAQGRSSSSSGQVWARKLTICLWQFYQKIWKERCQVVNEENKMTAEKRYRELLWQYHQELCAQAWKFSSDDRPLIEKTEEFFVNVPYRQLEIWKRQVDYATSTAKFKACLRNHDIREYISLVAETGMKERPRVRKEKKVRQVLVPTQVTYRQLQLQFLKTSEQVGDYLALRSTAGPDASKIRMKRKRVLTYAGEKEYIRNWLGISKGKRKGLLNKRCALNIAKIFFRKVDESSRSAAPMAGARKIKN